jgi:hypothetical protein
MLDKIALDKFWKPALAVAGIGAVGAFVFYSLYHKWLSLPIFSRLSPDHTFILMLVFLVFVFLGLIVMVIVWLVDRVSSARMAVTQHAGSITFMPPEGCTFKQAAWALAKDDQAVVEFDGFKKAELETVVKNQTVTVPNTTQAIGLLGKLTVRAIRPYTVEKTPGVYRVVVA